MIKKATTHVKADKGVNYNDLAILIVHSIATAHIMTTFDEPEHFLEVVASGITCVASQ